MMEKYTKSRCNSRIGEESDEKWMPPGSLFEVNERESIFENIVVERKTVLDLGAGTLRFSLAAVERGVGQVIAADLLKGMLKWGIEKAKRLMKAKERIAVIVADVRFLPFIDRAFDVATAVELFEHIPRNVELFTKEVNRVLKTSGEAVINTWNGVPRKLLSPFRKSERALEFWIGEFYYRYYYPWEFSRLLQSAHFSKVKVQGAYSIHFLPYLGNRISLDPPRGSIAIAFDRVFRKFRLFNQVMGKFLLATVRK